VGKEGREIIHKPRNTFSQPKKLLVEKSFTVLLPNHINILWSYLSEALWDVPRTSPLYQLSIFLSGKRLFPGWAIFFSVLGRDLSANLERVVGQSLLLILLLAVLAALVTAVVFLDMSCCLLLPEQPLAVRLLRFFRGLG